MNVALNQIVSSVLALLNESPDLSPALFEDEECSVLKVEDQIKALVGKAAKDATLLIPPMLSDETVVVSPEYTKEDKNIIVKVPGDFFRFVWLKMSDWEEPVMELTAPDTLRGRLRNQAPAWMINRQRPMVMQDCHADGSVIRVFGSNGKISGFCYERAPGIIAGGSGAGIVRIPEAVYDEMLIFLRDEVIKSSQI